MKEDKLKELANKLHDLVKEHPNDSALGREIRRIVNEIGYGK
jgi:hypothetical protein